MLLLCILEVIAAVFVSFSVFYQANFGKSWNLKFQISEFEIHSKSDKFDNIWNFAMLTNLKHTKEHGFIKKFPVSSDKICLILLLCKVWK